VYGFIADALAIVHLLFVVFVVAGGLAALRWPKLRGCTCRLPSGGGRGGDGWVCR